MVGVEFRRFAGVVVLWVERKVVNMDMERLPDFLTVEEAAAILRIGRTKAYQLVNLGFATGGREGLPAQRIGRQVRIPLRELEALNGGPLRLRRSS
jgi:excisionase family DNA binding protein